MAAYIGAKICSITMTTTDRIFITENGHKLQSRSQVMLPSQEVFRRHLLCNGMSLVSYLAFNNGWTPLLAWAEDTSNDNQEEDKGVLGVMKSIFDPNEKTKSGKVLPKAYLKSAREVVKTLRESLQEDPKDGAKFRRTADAAKESIRDYLSNWLGQQTVVQEESYVVLEKAIRSLAGFYSKAGPSAPLPEDVKSLKLVRYPATSVTVLHLVEYTRYSTTILASNPKVKEDKLNGGEEKLSLEKGKELVKL